MCQLPKSRAQSFRYHQFSGDYAVSLRCVTKLRCVALPCLALRYKVATKLTQSLAPSFDRKPSVVSWPYFAIQFLLETSRRDVQSAQFLNIPYLRKKSKYSESVSNKGWKQIRNVFCTFCFLKGQLGRWYCNQKKHAVAILFRKEMACSRSLQGLAPGAEERLDEGPSLKRSPSLQDFQPSKHCATSVLIWPKDCASSSVETKGRAWGAVRCCKISSRQNIVSLQYCHIWFDLMATVKTPRQYYGWFWRVLYHVNRFFEFCNTKYIALYLHTRLGNTSKYQDLY